MKARKLDNSKSKAHGMVFDAATGEMKATPEKAAQEEEEGGKEKKEERLPGKTAAAQPMVPPNAPAGEDLDRIV